MRATAWTRLLRPEDGVWVLLFSGLAAATPARHSTAVWFLICLGLLQVIEPKIAALQSPRGVTGAILVKLILCYLVIGWTGGINSSYYVVLLLPVVSAATTLGLLSTVLMTALAMLSYLSFLLYLDWGQWEFDRGAIRELSLRLIFLPVVAFLTHLLAAANREEARKYQAAASQLAAANRSLQEAEAAMRRSERLAALGQLTAGLAHELRNPLGTMRASAEMLTKSLDRDPAVSRELAGFIASEVDRTNSLITRFLEFARPLHLRNQPVQLHGLIDRAITELQQHNPPYDVTIYRNYALEVPPLQLDAELMERVVYNLLLNAAQATGAGGTVTVKTKLAGAEAELSVIDRGQGIAKEHLENIFNPFFTTKPDGVGLGLAIVSKIVDEHGGKISVESEAGSGSLFRVYLRIGNS